MSSDPRNGADEARRASCENEAEAKFRSLFDNMDDGYELLEVVRDAKNRPCDIRTLELNRAYEKQTGAKPEQFIGRLWSEFGIESERFDRVFRVAETGEPERHEDQSAFEGRFFEASFFKHSKDRIGVIFRDVSDRRRTEEALKESEERFRSVLDGSLDAIYRFNIQTARYEYVSPSFERVLDHTADEMMEMSIEQAMVMIHPDDVLGVSEVLAHLYERGEVEYDYRLQNKKGEYRWISNHISLVRDQEGRPLYRDGVIRNITEQKIAEQALKGNEERQAFLLELSDALRPLRDPLEVQAVVSRVVREHFRVDRCYYLELVDGNAVIVQEAARSGLSPIVGWYKLSEPPIFQAVIDAGRPLVVHDSRTSDLLDEPLRQMCLELKAISFIDVPVIKNGRSVGILSVVHSEPRDWTGLEVELASEAAERTWEAVEHTLTQEALRKSEAKYRGLFENLSEVIVMQRYVLDERGEVVDFTYVDLNPATEKALSKRRDELIGRTAGEVFGPEYIVQYLPLLSEIRRTSVPAAYESYFEPLDRYFLSLLVPLDEGTFINAALDITEIKRAQRQMEGYAKQLERSNEELQQFAYVASHDLQEPLRMVTTYLGLLEKKFGGDLPEQAKQYMRFAVDGSFRMKELIGDLLQYSRIDSQPLVLETIDMNDKMKMVIEDLHVAIEDAGGEVIVDPLPSVRGDKAQIKQLLMNLISNAIKFRRDAEPRIEVSAVTYDGEFVFSIKDNGIGIDPKYADKLFKMFSRLHTRDEYPGTGIGLAVSKKIVEKHGGMIWFESKPGKGSTFFFTLPTLDAVSRPSG